MTSHLDLGRLRGFPVAVHWSVLLVALLLSWSLATGLLPSASAGLPATAYWAAGLFGAVLLFTSILTHELAHALVARRDGIEVAGIELWLFGGVAGLKSEATTPSSELRIAAAGPATSLALGGSFAVLAAASGTISDGSLVTTVFTWLAVANIVLAVFNLLPGAPLDGGRILRALLWRRHGDRYRATLTATSSGRFVGYGLVGFGLAEVFAGVGYGGLWTALVGWFLLTAAKAERAVAVAEHDQQKTDAAAAIDLRDDEDDREPVEVGK